MSAEDRRIRFPFSSSFSNAFFGSVESSKSSFDVVEGMIRRIRPNESCAGLMNCLALLFAVPRSSFEFTKSASKILPSGFATRSDSRLGEYAIADLSASSEVDVRRSSGLRSRC